MPLIFPANTVSAAAYSIDNSCRFNSDAYVHRTFASAGNVDRWSFSCWFKLGDTAGNIVLFAAAADANNYGEIRVKTAGTISWEHYASASDVGQLHTTRKLRDFSAWYHLLCVYDSANGTAGNRMRMYLNGVEETVFGTDTNPSSGADSPFNKDDIHSVGATDYATGSFQNFWDGYMAEVVFIDGTAYGPTDFGEFDEDSPTIWKPVDPSGLTFGTNGFYLDFKASDNLGNDANGGTDWAEVSLAATDQTTDTPTNNFCTWNPVGNPRIDSGSVIEPTYSEGNTMTTHAGGSNVQATTTFFVNKGKWYMECECDAIGSGNTATLGILEDTDFGEAGETHVYRNNGNYVSGSYGDTYTSGDILSMAFDATNGTIWFAKNGTWQNSATEGEIEAGTTTNAAEASLDTTISWTILTKGLSDNIMKANFGTAYADTISSGNADGNGYGNFEYAVPSGFYALCTKNLAEFG
jgi:hypothetical protein